MRNNYYRTRIIVRNRRIMLFAGIILTILVAFCVFGNRAAAENSREVNTYYTSYEIQDGDTLWTIADQFMTPENSDKDAFISNIKRMNHMLDDNIQSGNYLVIEYYAYN